MDWLLHKFEQGYSSQQLLESSITRCIPFLDLPIEH